MFVLEGNNCLLRYNTAGYARHNYSFKRMSSNGNVYIAVLEMLHYMLVIFICIEYGQSYR
jgi:hypothetical protein